MSIRKLLVRLHRWIGLAVTLFLIIVGLTGSVLAFQDELDLWLNPDLLSVAPHQGEEPLDPLLLREKVAALHPEARVNSVPLTVTSSRSLEFTLTPKDEGGASDPIQLFIDPFTGDKLGERVWGRVSLTRQNIIPFLYRLHYSLALPASAESLGGYILGVVALLWTIDCFVSFYLTLPLRRREAGSRKSWWTSWKPAWLIKWTGGAYRINFDIHRAVGLWTWAMLFVFAWSSVGFNLNEVFRPTMTALFGLSETAAAHSARAQSLDAPKLDWPAARQRGHVLIDQLAAEHGFRILREDGLSFDREQGVYALHAKSSIDPGKRGATYVLFDADNGALKQAAWPGQASERTGDVISRWLFMLHMAGVFGLPMQIFVCVMGLVIATLSITGVYIWWKRRCARVKSRHVPVGASPDRVSHSWRSVVSVAWSSTTAAAKRPQQSRGVRH